MLIRSNLGFTQFFKFATIIAIWEKEETNQEEKKRSRRRIKQNRMKKTFLFIFVIILLLVAGVLYKSSESFPKLLENPPVQIEE